jgi:DNA-binding FadR family transcriptional regulator
MERGLMDHGEEAAADGGASPRRLSVTASVVAPSEGMVFEEVFHFFKAQLMAGDLRPGDRLLPERDLAQRLGVSRASLREAMRSLALLGVVEIRPGQGAFIRKPDLGILQDFFSIVLSMHPALYEQVLEARIAIECHAIRLACQAARPEDLRSVETALERIDPTLGDPDLGAEADFEFHSAIVAASRNEMLAFIHEAIAALLKRSHHERREAVVHDPGFLAILGADHRRLYEALRTGNPDVAEVILRDHFTIAQRYAAGRIRPPD